MHIPLMPLHAVLFPGMPMPLAIFEDRYLRMMAYFKNYRRRIERDGNKIADESKRSMIRQARFHMPGDPGIGDHFKDASNDPITQRLHMCAALLAFHLRKP